MAQAENKLDLVERHCQPCEQGGAPLAEAAITTLKRQLKLPWKLVNGTSLRHIFSFNDFANAMVFVNDIAAIAEAEGHHPDLHINYKKVTVDLTTHSMGGLSENDFILARKIELCR